MGCARRSRGRPDGNNRSQNCNTEGRTDDVPDHRESDRCCSLAPGSAAGSGFAPEPQRGEGPGDLRLHRLPPVHHQRHHAQHSHHHGQFREHGVDCAGTTAYFYFATRNADSTCPPIGTPPLITIKAQTRYMTTNSGQSTAGPTPSGAGGYAGRVPSTITNVAPLNSPANLYIHLRGGDDNMQGA